MSEGTVVESIRTVLFVDDEPMVLAGLRRSMHSLRQVWRCTYAESGREALKRMSETPFDVVVTDMMMPEMTGAELLREVRRLHPATVRIILSGQADPALVAQCVNDTHRFLEKPCDIATLKTTLEYATSIVFALSDPGLLAQVGRIRQLPSPPELCRELEKRLSKSQVSVEEIGELIARDVAMTANVLKVVNSSYFGLAREIETAQEAVAYLGVETIRSLAMFSELSVLKLSPGVEASWVKRLWEHSLIVSVGARCIAELEGAPARVVKEAATAGLLHDTGKLIGALNFPVQTQEAEREAKTQGVALTKGEQVALGCTHAAIGGYLFALWGLSLPVVQAVAWHHTPENQVPAKFGPTLIVHVADALAHELFKEAEGGITPNLNEAYLADAGVLDKLPRWREALSTLWGCKGV